VASGESYVAGRVALNERLGAPRLSRDVDLFHDTESALDAELLTALPAEEAGKCVLRSGGL
jgi:hypothetical protein